MKKSSSAWQLTSRLKTDSRDQALANIRTQLSGAERAFSRLLHRPGLETLSDVAAGSFGRPCGLLGGGSATFIGSVLVLLVCSHYGYSYPFVISAPLFIGGFLIGEIIGLFRRRQ